MRLFYIKQCILELYPNPKPFSGEDGKGHAVLYWVDAHSGQVTFRSLCSNL